MASREIVVRLRADIAQYEAAMMRASAATKGVATSATAAAKTATAANTGLGKSAAATAVGMKAASNGMSGVASAARGTSGSISALGSGMTVASASAGRLGSGMKAAASNTAGVSSAVRGASGSITALGSGMAVAGSAATRASGGLKGVGGAAAAAGAGATRASGGLKALGGNASTTAAAATAASGGLRGMGGAASAAGAGALQASGGLKQVGGAASAAATGAAAAKGSLDGVGSAAKGASSNATAAATGFSRLSGSIKENKDAWGDLSSKAMIGGAAIVGGLGLATKAAINWESAWAGVAKTVDGTDAQMAKLEDGLRGLARELPATHQEIAGVAEAAGQLGVARDDILKFTEVAIGLGEATNLSAEEAATSLAQFSNIMGTVAREGVIGYEKLGSTLVELGNNGASTEKQIMEMSLRLAGAGQQIGATEADIMAMANALTSVGINAELGGGAMSRGMLQMNSAVIEGGDKLEKFAEISGMTASQFAAKWRADPVAATNEFITGLGRIGDSGGDAAGALGEVGLKGTQNAQVFLRAAGASDIMTDSLKMGESAWRENGALADEVGKRYATAESRIRVAGNQVKDAAIDIGAVVAPAFAKAVEGAAGLAKGFQSLPGPAKSVITGISGFTGATLLIGGATVKAISGLQSLRDTLDQVGLLTPRVEKGLGAVGRAAVGLGAILVGVAALNKLDSAFQAAAPSANDLADALDKVASSGSMKSLNSEFQRFFDQTSTHKALFGDMSSDIKGVGEAVAYLNDKGKVRGFLDWKNDLIGLDSESKKAKDGLAEMDKVLTQLLQQDPARGREVWRGLVEDAKKAGVSVKELEAAFPGAVAAMKEADRSAKENGAANAEMAEQMADAEQAADDLSDAIKGLGETLLGQRGGARDYKAALDEASAALKENGRTLDINTEKGRANEEALDGIAESAQDYAAAVFESTGSVEKAQGVLDRGRKSYIDMAVSMGMGKEEARSLADELFQIPDDVSTEFEAKGADLAKQKTTDWKGVLTGVPSEKKTNISAPGATESKSKVLDLGTSITNLDGKTVKVTEDGAQSSQVRVRELDGTLVGLPSSKKVQVTEVGSTAAGEMVVQFKDKVFAIPKSKTTQIREEGSGASKARVMGLNDSIKLLNGKTVKVGEDGAQKAKGRVVQLDGSIFGLKGKTVKVEEIGATASGDRVVRFDGKIYTLKGKTVEVKETGADASRGRVDMLKGAIGSVYGKNTDVRANVHGKWDVDGLRNSIQATNSKTVTVTAIRRIKNMFADGGLLEGGVQTFADGGFASIGSQRPQIRAAGGKGITWAEDGAGPWEAFISGHPAKSARSKQIWMETGRRLGMIEAHAEGAVRQYAQPAPPVRQHVPPAPRMAPAPVPAGVGSGPSAAEMQAAFASAMSTMRPVVQIGGRDFYGVMQRTANDRKGRG